ncbi:MAG: transglutaminase family protein [Lachnospiraceae bacterium]
MQKKMILLIVGVILALGMVACSSDTGTAGEESGENMTASSTKTNTGGSTDVTTETHTQELSTAASTQVSTKAPIQLETVAPTKPVATAPSELLNTEPVNPKSSGYAELDTLTSQVLAEVTKPGMSKYQQVVACYDWFLDNISYTGNMHMSPGKFADSDPETTPKEVLWAIDILAARKGNCYNFASGFMYLMRAIGYDAHLVSGTTVNTSGQYTEHCWMYINLGGKAYSFDPDIDMDRKNRGQGYAYFCRLMSDMLKYSYRATTYYEN